MELAKIDDLEKSLDRNNEEHENRVYNITNNTQNNQYIVSTKGEIKSTVVRCGLDLNSDDYEWIPSEQREFIHRNVLYQIDHFKIVEPKEAKSSDMGSMLIFYLKVIGGYSLVQKKFLC